MRGRLFYVPLLTAITPIDGEVLCNRWWSVHPEKGLAFYMHTEQWDDDPSPQCNLHRSIVERFGSGRDGCTPQFIEVVYLGHAHTARWKESPRKNPFPGVRP